MVAVGASTGGKLEPTETGSTTAALDHHVRHEVKAPATASLAPATPPPRPTSQPATSSPVRPSNKQQQQQGGLFSCLSCFSA